MGLEVGVDVGGGSTLLAWMVDLSIGNDADKCDD